MKKYVIFVIIAALYAGLLYKYLHSAPKRDYSDFRVYYAAAERFISRQDLYAESDTSITPFKYSPAFAMLVSWLSFFSKKTAGVIFFSINFIALISVFILSGKLIIRNKISTKQKIFLYAVPAIYTIRFITYILYTGQVNIIMLALLLCGFYFLDKRKDVAAASCIGLSIMFKYTPFILLPFFIFRKKFKLAALILLFIAFYCLMPTAYLGIKTNALYLKNWIPSIISTSLASNSFYDFKNQSLYSMMLRFFTVNLPHPPLTYMKTYITSLSFSQGMALSVIMAMFIYALIILPGRRQKLGQPEEYSLLLICMALFNPNAWLATFVFCIFAYMFLCYYLLRVHFKDKLTMALMFLCFIFMVGGSEFLAGDKLQNLFFQLSFITIGALTLLFMLLRLKFKKVATIA